MSFDGGDYEPRRIGSSKPFRLNLDVGWYDAKCLGYNIDNGRLVVIFDVDGKQSEPNRVRMYVNARWWPSILNSNIVGLISGDAMLARLTDESLGQIVAVGELHRAFAPAIKCRVLLGLSQMSDGRKFNDIKQVMIGERNVIQPEKPAERPQPDDEVPF